MARYVLGRVASSLVVLVLSTILVFIVISVSGDPLAELRDRQPPVSESVLDAEEARLGLDRPLPERYVTWITGLAQGDWGPSTVATRDIGVELASRVGVTLRLVSVAVGIALILGLLIGTVSGLTQRRLFDNVFTPVTFLFLALPSFWLAVILKQWGILVNSAVGANVFATVGANSPQRPTDFWGLVADSAAHLVLPTIALILIHFAAWSRYQRGSIVDALASDHVRFAVLKGLSRRRVISAYVVRPSLVPFVTIVALDLPVLFSGAVITESVFQWRGMGSFLIESINLRDTNAVLGWLLIASCAVIAFNLLADLLYGLIDPRIRHD
ncbi:MAG: ABC transporter permease [Protaetiibacter sp.]